METSCSVVSAKLMEAMPSHSYTGLIISQNAQGAGTRRLLWQLCLVQ